MARSKPTTSYYLKYGAVTTADTAETLTPVFIGPRYGVHNAANSNYLTSGAIISGASVANIDWPQHASGAVIDSGNARVFAINPVVDLGGAGGAALATTGSGSVITFAGAVTGPDSIIQDKYQVRPGDQLILANGSAHYVTSVGGETTGTGVVKTSTGSAAPTWSAAYTGSVNATYIMTAITAVSGGSVTMRIAPALGDMGFEPTTSNIVSGSVNSIGTLGATVTPTLSNVTSGGVYFLECTPAGAGVTSNVYIAPALTSSGTINYVRTSNAVVGGSAALRGGDWSVNASGGILVSASAKCINGSSTYPVWNADIAVEYRELLTDTTNELVNAADATTLEWVGDQSPANPIGEAYKAAIQTGYNGFFLVATNGTDDEAYQAAIQAAGKVEDAYALIPIEQTQSNISDAIATVAFYSQPTIAQMKRTWVYSQLSQNSQLLPNGSIQSVVGTVSGTSVTGVTAGALSAVGVAKGDIVTFKNVYNSTTQNYGDVSAVILGVNGDTITLESNPDAVAGTYGLVITRKLTPTQLAQAVAAEARTYSNVRVNYVYAEPNTVAGDSFNNAQYILPVLATMRNQLPPHAPLTDVPIPGVSISTGIGFSESDLDIMNDAGVWVCYRDGRGEMVTRHAITTGGDGTIAEEDSAVSNGDNILRTIRNNISWLRGNCNVTPALIDQIYTNVMHAIDRIRSRVYDALIGPQILDVESIEVKQDPNNSAGVIGTFNLDLPDVYLDGKFTVNLF